MRKLNQVIRAKQHELKQFEQIDMGLQALMGKRFNENKIGALQAFLTVAKEAELEADKIVHLNKKRH